MDKYDLGKEVEETASGLHENLQCLIRSERLSVTDLFNILVNLEGIWELIAQRS